jgi:hypothetical protein
MPRPLSALTALIRSLPADLPVADVIARTTEKGMEATEQNVAEVREMASAKPAADKTVAKATAAPTSETGPTSKPAAISKTDFIRNQPLGLSVASVVAMAKAQGITLSESLVRLVRGPDGRRPRASTSRKTPAVKKAAKKNLAASKAPASKPAPISKSDFIRQQPASMSVADVIAKAKAQGMNIGRSLVYMVRERSTAKKAGPKDAPAKKTTAPPKQTTASKTAAPQKTTATPQRAPAKVATMSKADFVSANPGLSAKYLAGKAAFEGFDLSESCIYGVRRADKVAAKKRAAARNAASKPVVATPVVSTQTPNPNSSSSALEDLLRAVAAELGLGRAVEILAGERARVRAVIGAV